MRRRGNVVSPVDSINTLVEQLQQTDFTVEDGETVWCRATQCLWVYRVNSGLTADGINVVTSLYGNGGVWARLSEGSSAAAMGQSVWVIDPVNGNDANSGLTAATALKTDAERQRRMGAWPTWTQEEYHIRYLNDVPTSDPIVFVGQWKSQTGNIYLHGSMTNSQGKATLASLAIDAVTPVNHATNTALLITSNGIVTSWTADGLLNQRCRLTSGANVGGVFWPTADLGAKQARMNEPQPAQTFTNPPPFISTTFAPALNDTFVVESLVSLGSVRIGALGISNGQRNTVVWDSLTISEFCINGTSGVLAWGCDWASTASGPNSGRIFNLAGTRLRANSKMYFVGVIDLINSYADDSAAGAPVFTGALNSFAINCMTQQRGGIRLDGMTTVIGGGSGSVKAWTIQNGMGIFNNTTGPGVDVASVTLNAAAEIWGVCGAGGTPFFLQEGAGLYYTAPPPGLAGFFFINVAAAPGAAWISYRRASAVQTTAPAWDLATSTFTGYRALTPALIQATVAGGGFNGQFFDPPSGATLGAL
jgi:hypothetical protein